MKSNSSSLLVQALAACAVFVSALSVINAQTLQKAPDNPAFLQYQQERAQRAAAAKTVSGYGRGYIPPPVDLSYLRDRTPAHIRAFQALPSSYDLRTQGKLTPIKNQNPYGTCWAFATYGSLESALMPTEERYFSVNSMVNNHGFDYGYDDGGQAFMSTAYLTRWSGPINEVDDPYTNGPGHSPSGLTVRKHVQEVLLLPLKADALDNTTIKQAVVDYGAVYVSMYADFNTNYYYNSTNFSFYYNGDSNTDHAVTIVGWDDDYSAGKFKQTPPGNGAFIVRNSWGTNFGEQGYFYCSYYDSKMGYDENAAFNNAAAVTNYGSIYQYDPLGRVNDCGYGSTNAWAANIFTATNSEPLRAVGFYATDIDMNYKIYIYQNVTTNSPTNGTLALSQTGTLAYSGYHTVALNTPVTMSSGQVFSVVIQFVNSSHTSPIAIEYARSNYSSRATSSPGQSYVSHLGTSWSDLTTEDPTANVCIKAFCGTGSVVVVSLADPVIVSASGGWYVWFSGSGYQMGGPWNLGVAGTPVTGDFDGDRYSDPAIVDNAGNWYVWFTSLGYQMGGPYSLGGSGTPVAGDFDGDGYADPAMVASTGAWRVWFTSLGYQMGGPYSLGGSGIPVAGDFDGDRYADPAMVASTGAWYVWYTSLGYQMGGPYNLGVLGTPVAGDFDGDGYADPTMVDNTGAWYVWYTSLGYQMGGPYNLGVLGTPLAADFDGR